MGIAGMVGKAASAANKKRKEKKAAKAKKEDVNESVSKKIKEVFKMMITALLMILKPIIPILLIITILMMAIGAVLDKIVDIIKAIGDFFQKLWYGERIVVSDADADKLIEDLYDRGITMESLGMEATSESVKDVETEEGANISITKEQRKYIKEFIAASKVTSSFYSNDKGINVFLWFKGSKLVYDGAITVHMMGKNGNLQTLTYSGSNSNGSNLFPGENFNFTEDGKILFAINDGYDYKIEEIDYYDGILNADALPVMFFIDLCETTQNPEYVSALAIEAMKKTEIKIYILNNETTSEIKKVDKGNFLLWPVDEVSTYNKNSTITNLGIVGSAKTIFYNYERDILSYRTQTNQDEIVNMSDVPEEYKSEDDSDEVKFYKVIANYSNVVGGFKTAAVYFKQNDIFPKLTKKMYEVNDTKGVQSPDKALEDGADQLFENMDRNCDNERLIQVLKYILYKMTNRSYGVTELDLDLDNATYYLGDFKVSTYEDDIPVVTDRDELIDIFAQRNGLKKGDYDYDIPTFDQVKANWNLIKGGRSNEPQLKLINFKYVVDDILEAQEKYSINALFIMACSEQESNTGGDSSNGLVSGKWGDKTFGGGTTWNWTSMDTGNSMYFSMKDEDSLEEGTATSWDGLVDSGGTHNHTAYNDPKYCFYDFAHYAKRRVSQGRDTVDAIGITFCGAAWCANVKKLITEFCMAGGLIIKGVNRADGPGYEETVTFNGRTFKLYKQGWGYYGFEDYNNGYSGIGPMDTQGCGPTTMAVLLSGYGGSLDPFQIAKMFEPLGGTAEYTAPSIFQQIGLPYSKGTVSVETIRNQLRKGNQIYISVARDLPYGGEFIHTETLTARHIISILAIKDDSDLVFVANTNCKESTWHELSHVVAAAEGRYCYYIGGN